MSIEHEQQNNQYKSVSKAAVLSLVFALIGLLSFLGAVFIVLPALAIICGIVALGSLKRYPEELVGKSAAMVGVVLGLIGLVGAGSMHAYIYATEVPEGYTRISFAQLKPNKRTQLHYSEKADAFDGKKVFIRGYVRPGKKKQNLKNFIMVGDWGQCCFGGNPKITDVVGISIKTDDRVNYGLGVRKIGGTFRLRKNAKRTNDEEVPAILYEIEADHVR